MLWPGQSVSDSSMNACISRVREAIGDRDIGQRMIKTFARFGYRFMAEVMEGASPQKSSATAWTTQRALLKPAGFFGRDRELEFMQQMIAAVARGQNRIVFLGGDAGIGKSELITQTMRLASERQFGVLQGRCDETEEPLTLWPWVQLVRAYATVQSADVLDRVFGAESSDLAALVPSLGRAGRSAPTKQLLTASRRGCALSMRLLPSLPVPRSCSRCSSCSRTCNGLTPSPSCCCRCSPAIFRRGSVWSPPFVMPR